MSLKRKRRKTIEQGKRFHLTRRLEKLKTHKEHYLNLLKANLLPDQSRKLVNYQLQKLLKQITILERRI
ncbi:MAG: hypothetical protein AB4062_04225 [Crocosphaera sp.]